MIILQTPKGQITIFQIPIGKMTILQTPNRTNDNIINSIGKMTIIKNRFGHMTVNEIRTND